MEALLHHTADKYLNRLNTIDRDRINAALDDLEKEPPEGDIIPVDSESLSNLYFLDDLPLPIFLKIIFC